MVLSVAVLTLGAALREIGWSFHSPPTSAMGALPVRLPDVLHEKVRDLADAESISMNQFVMLAVSEMTTRLDADAQFAPLDVLEQFAAAVAEEEEKTPDQLMKELLDRARNEARRPDNRRPTAQKK